MDDVYLFYPPPPPTKKLFLGILGKKIIERVHNVAEKKRPRSDEGEGTAKAKHGRPKQSLRALALTTYPPLRDACTGDDTTLSRNIELLHKERVCVC